MALTVKSFETPDGSIFENVYMKVQKVQIANADYEHFENVNDPLRPDVEQELKWIKRLETTATIYVWADELCRENRAQIISWFSITFDYDLTAYENIFEQVYKKLKKIYPDSEGC